VPPLARPFIPARHKSLAWVTSGPNSGSFATLAVIRCASSPEGWNKARVVAFSGETSRGPLLV